MSWLDADEAREMVQADKWGPLLPWEQERAQDYVRPTPEEREARRVAWCEEREIDPFPEDGYSVRRLPERPMVGPQEFDDGRYQEEAA